MAKNKPTVVKAKKMLHEGTANGQPLTEKQKGYFGLIAGRGAPMASQPPRVKRGKK